jgi:Rod binding domain-containing protein
MTTITALANANTYHPSQKTVRYEPAPRTLKEIAATSTLDMKTLKKIDEAAKDFEASFLSEMMKPMFAGIEVDENFGGGKGEEVFRDFMTQEYGKKMAGAGGIGIATLVRDQMISQQEGAAK